MVAVRDSRRTFPAPARALGAGLEYRLRAQTHRHRPFRGPRGC